LNRRRALRYARGMKSLLQKISAVTTFAALAAAALGFEGKVSLSMKSGRDAEQVIDYAMKGTRVRLEPKIADAGGTAMIMNWEKQEMTILMPEQQMYMVMPLKSAMAAGQAKAAAAEQKIEKTGRTEKILGYTCDEYVTTEGGNTTEMWITEELGSFAGLGGGGNPMAGMMGGGRSAPAPANSWENVLKSRKGAFPLRVVSRDGKGRETFRLEARKVEPGALPESLFTPPADYQKFAMPMMPGAHNG
jgi:hypothetical protein